MRLWARWTELFEDDDPAEPRFDPVHLAAVVVATQVAAGSLFWLLWTIFVYEGGPASPEGRVPRAVAVAIAALIVAALHRLDRRR